MYRLWELVFDAAMRPSGVFQRPAGGSRAWVSALLLVLPCSPVTAGPAIEDYPVPGHGELRLQVPAEWQVQYLYTEDARVRPTLYVSPLDGQAFQMTVTVYWYDGLDTDIASAESLRKRVGQAGNLAMQDSTETAVSILKFDGIQQPGFYYDLHDGSATAEEYHYLTQGAYAVGQLVLAFTILTDERPSAHREACLNFLRVIRQLGAARDVRGARIVVPLSRWL